MNNKYPDQTAMSKIILPSILSYLMKIDRIIPPTPEKTTFYDGETS
jgi:hypothetical protein